MLQDVYVVAIPNVQRVAWIEDISSWPVRASIVLHEDCVAVKGFASIGHK